MTQSDLQKRLIKIGEKNAAEFVRLLEKECADQKKRIAELERENAALKRD